MKKLFAIIFFVLICSYAPSGRAGADILVTTEKDGMRLQEFGDFLNQIYFLRIAMEIIPDKKRGKLLFWRNSRREGI